MVDDGFVPPATGSRPLPRSQRGLRTRATLISAARTVFERDGYLDSRLSDITAEAGVAAGSFYTYFDDKEELLAALTAEVQEQMLHPHLRERTGIDDPRALIDLSNREYLQQCKQNAKLLAVWEQAAQVNDDFKALRLERMAAFVQRNARMIGRLQELGRADVNLDPQVAAEALSAMTSGMAHVAYVLGEPIEWDVLVGTINQIWINALGLEESPGALRR